MNPFVIADPKKCIGCYACVAGCVEGHREAGLQAYPRLCIIRTPPIGTMPLQCHQCESPACEAVCPVKAISIQDNSICLNESLCIGCKLCAIACPFGAIIPGGTPIPHFDFNAAQYTYHNTPYQPDPMYLREFAHAESLSLLSWEIGQKTVAVKCDLCYFREEGPACVIACPHKALRLVDGKSNGRRAFIQEAKAIAGMETGESQTRDLSHELV